MVCQVRGRITAADRGALPRCGNRQASFRAKHDTKATSGARRSWPTARSVYIGDTTGTLSILAAAREKKIINKIKFDAGICQTPIVANGVMYVATDQRLYAIPCLEH